MPMRSKAQNRLFQGCEHSRGSMVHCPPKKVVHEFVSAQRGKPVKGLPERIGEKKEK